MPDITEPQFLENMTEKYDVIIIGAGIGGLTAGAILSKNGRKVLILEKNNTPGGYAVNFKRGDFEFDASLHLMNGCYFGGKTRRILSDCGIDNKITFLNPHELCRVIFPHFDFKIPQRSLSKYLNSLIRLFPQDKIQIIKLFKEVQKIYIKIYAFDQKSKLSSEFIQSMRLTSQEIIDKYINNERLKAIISQLWTFFGLPPSKLPLFYYCYPWYDYLKNGGYYPKGGARTLSETLKKQIEHTHGEILINKKVKRIIVKDSFAKSVLTEEGKEYFANTIISNIDARQTFHGLIGDKNLPSHFLDNLDKMVPSISAFQVYLGLNINIRKLGITDFEISYNPDYDIDQHFLNSLHNNLDNPAFALTIYSNLDKTSTPGNKTNLVITTYSGYDFWKKMSPEQYKNYKENFAQRLIQKSEEIIPNLSSYIKNKIIATPLTMERYTGNYKGAIYGWEQNVFQTGINRLDKTTPIKNLYLVGAWTRPGGGITGVMYSGKSVANEILKRQKLHSNI